VGTKFFESDLQKFDNAFSQYTQYFLYFVVGLKALQRLRTKENRAEVIELVKQAVTGQVKSKVTCPDTKQVTYGDVLPKVAPDPQKLDHNSEHFIAPANIFRVCAVLHPGKIGWMKYQEFAMSGAVTVYMQVFLPCKILSNQFARWEMVGFKSPLWFGTHMGMFVTSFAALASLVKVFKGKCAQIITETAQANCYLLAKDENPDNEPKKPKGHEEDGMIKRIMNFLPKSPLTESLLPTKVAPESEAGESPGESTKDVAVAAAEEGKSPGEPIASTEEPEEKKEEEPALGAGKKPHLDPTIIWLIKLAWCMAGLFSDIIMSTLLLFSMVIKVATFTGQIQDIALVMVSLYFVFNLQYQILDTDPNIKLEYMKAVKGLTVETEHNISKVVMHVKERVAAIMLIFVSFIGPIGLAIIVLAAWHDKQSPTGCIIGIDPFKGMADCGGI